MEITEVRIKLMEDNSGSNERLQAFCSITFDDMFVIRDLKIIEGVGPAMEKLVNSLGFYHYDQIADWSADELAWVDSHMKTFRGRIVRDRWQAQAKIILAEGVPAFLERAKTNNY